MKAVDYMLIDASTSGEGSPRQPLAVGHPLVGHDVHRPAADPHLGRPLPVPPADHTRPEDRLQPGHRRLTQSPPVVARLLLPRRPPDLAPAEVGHGLKRTRADGRDWPS